MAAIGNAGKVVEYGGARIMVSPLSVGESRRVEALRLSVADEGGNDAFMDAIVGVFIKCAKDPDTGEPYATEAERAEIYDNVPTELVLRVLQASVSIDVQGAAKN